MIGRKTNQLIKIIYLGESVFSGTFSSDGEYIITLNFKKVLKIRTLSGKLIKEIVTDISINHDKIVIKYNLFGILTWGEIKIFCLSSGELLTTFNNSIIRKTMKFDFASDGKYLITAGWDQVITIWSLESGSLGEEVKSFSSLDKCRVLSLVVMDNYIITSDFDKNVKIWDLILGREIFNQTLDFKVSKIILDGTNMICLNNESYQVISLLTFYLEEEIKTSYIVKNMFLEETNLVEMIFRCFIHEDNLKIKYLTLKMII